MHKYLPRKITDIKGKTALAELRRTHYIVAILAVALIAVLVSNTLEVYFTTPLLTFAAIALLALLTLMSLGTAIGLSRLIKK